MQTLCMKYKTLIRIHAKFFHVCYIQQNAARKKHKKRQAHVRRKIGCKMANLQIWLLSALLPQILTKKDSMVIPIIGQTQIIMYMYPYLSKYSFNKCYLLQSFPKYFLITAIVLLKCPRVQRYRGNQVDNQNLLKP